MAGAKGAEKAKPERGGKLGTFAGVFTPSIMTIVGVILFLRLGYVVGEAGLGRALLIVAVANGISVLTSLSLAAISTNLKVKAGGDYYLISRTLGLRFGGSIGLVLYAAQAISVGFYAIAFAEAATALLELEGPLAIRAIAGAAVALLVVPAWLGAGWATRVQYVVMALIAAALVSFAIGAGARFDGALLSLNWTGAPGAPAFWILFAIFFPAVTGFTQGVSMSGDLERPSRSIPLGTFLAVGLSMAVYLAAAVALASAVPGPVLRQDYGAMQRVALFAPAIDAGLLASALSSALACLLGGPRILQALARDRIFPKLHVFAPGAGAADNPRRAVALTAAIALAVVALGELNLIAPLVSMFFLISYGLLNYATYFEAKAASPSFRPSFRWFHPLLSLAGGLACLAVMLAIDPLAGLAALAVLGGVLLYLGRRTLPARWADSRRSHHLGEARKHLLRAAAEPEHARDWRPQLLAFSDSAERRGRLLRFAAWISGGAGLITVVRMIEGDGPDMIARREAAARELAEELRGHGSDAFPLVVAGADLAATMPVVVQTAGVGPLRANTVLANWIDGPPAFLARLGGDAFSRNLRTAFRLGSNLLVLDVEAEEWRRLDDRAPADRVIDVWWTPRGSGRLALLLAYLMTRDDDWADAEFRVLVPTGGPGEDALAAVRALLAEARIEAEPTPVEGGVEALVARSRASDVVFLPFAIHGGRFFHPFGGEVGDLLPRLPVAVLTLAAQDIDLAADPDTGPASERAAALDRAEDARRRLDSAEAAAAKAARAAAEAAEALAEARGAGRATAEIADLERSAAKALAAAEAAARRRRRAQAAKNGREARAATLGAQPEADADAK